MSCHVNTHIYENASDLRSYVRLGRKANISKVFQSITVPRSGVMHSLIGVRGPNLIIAES